MTHLFGEHVYREKVCDRNIRNKLENDSRFNPVVIILVLTGSQTSLNECCNRANKVMRDIFGKNRESSLFDSSNLCLRHLAANSSTPYKRLASNQ